jgi:hypothetical protein
MYICNHAEVQPPMSAARTHHKRKAFLDQLELGMSPSYSAQAAGESLSFFKRWRDSDDNFKADWDEALEGGTDFLEDEATLRAVKKSDTLMLAMLKARRPDKFDRGHKLELSGGISVDGSKQKLLNKLAKIRGAIEGPVLAAVNSDQGEEAGSKEEKATLALPSPSREPTPDPGGSKRKRATAGGRGSRASA